MTWLHLITVIYDELDKDTIDQFDEVTPEDLKRILKIASNT